MADSAAFEWVCGELEDTTSLSGLEARGTVRLALKQAGLEAKRVKVSEMAVVLNKMMPAELVSRGVEDGEGCCAGLVAGLNAAGLTDEATESPEAVFSRLGG
jgi:hypothetical protein